MAKKGTEEIGVQYGKRDIERLGLFIEMPYMNGKGYKPIYVGLEPVKGKSMLTNNLKTKCGTQDCYFDNEFRRLFIGEGIPEMVKKEKKAKPAKMLPPMIPAGNPKLHGCPGDYFGCFSKFTAFGNQLRKEKPREKGLKSFVTNPGKKGSYGYKDITIGKFPEYGYNKYGIVYKAKEYGKIRAGPMRTMHFPEPYFDKNPLFDPKPGPTYVPPKTKEKPFRPPGHFTPIGPTKWQGGSHAGCFDKFPAFMPCKYVSIYEANKPYKPDKVFHAHSTGVKTLQTTSIINMNTDFKVNAETYAKYEPSYTKNLLNFAQ